MYLCVCNNSGLGTVSSAMGLSSEGFEAYFSLGRDVNTAYHYLEKFR